MPCNCDYMEPNAAELMSVEIACHIVYVDEARGFKTDAWIEEIAKHAYGKPSKREELTILLCATLRGMNSEELDKIVYDGRKKAARSLAGWWEDHQEDDARHAREELIAVEQDALRLNALNKLSDEEKEALGVDYD